MSETVRNVAGLGFAALVIGIVLLAGVATPQPNSVLQASAKCPDAAKEFPLPETSTEAQRPA